MSIFKRDLFNVGTSAEAEEQWEEQKITHLAKIQGHRPTKAIHQDDPKHLSRSHLIKIRLESIW